MGDDASVEVVLRKFDGRLHRRNTSRWLGEDEHGIWLGSPAGSIVHTVDGPWEPSVRDSVRLIPHHGWWSAIFFAAPNTVDLYCDVCTAPRWEARSSVTMIDLDLDVMRTTGGAVEAHDDDEFAEHRLRYGYPQDVVRHALAARDWLVSAISAGVEPFASAYRPWLAEVG